MSKSKNKNHSEVEHLKGIIKRLKSQLKYYKRRSHINDETSVDIKINEITPDCPNCGKGVMDNIDLYKIIIRKCNICGYQEKTKK